MSDPSGDPRGWVAVSIHHAAVALQELQALAKGYPNVYADEVSHLAALGLGFSNLATWAAKIKEKEITG